MQPQSAPWLQRNLQQLQASKSHALLLHGPTGLGQWPLAQALAASTLCEAPLSDGTACGQCAACHLLDSHSHPDCYYLLPETLALDWGYPLDEKTQKALDEKKRKPSKIISIDAVREVTAATMQTSARARGQVVLVYPAESMTLQAANAFLKTLEEPQGDVKIIMATEAADQLLPTIRSRCASFALGWPAAQEAQDYLQAIYPHASAAQIELALRASGGRPFDAENWLAGNLLSNWADLPRALATGRSAALADYTPAAAIDALQKLCHDLWAIKVQGEPRYFAKTDLPRPPSARALHEWAVQLTQWARSIEHPYKTDLLLEDMVAQSWRYLQQGTVRNTKSA